MKNKTLEAVIKALSIEGKTVFDKDGFPYDETESGVFSDIVDTVYEELKKVIPNLDKQEFYNSVYPYEVDFDNYAK